jgi:hypothetical protein
MLGAAEACLDDRDLFTLIPPQTPVLRFGAAVRLVQQNHTIGRLRSRTRTARSKLDERNIANSVRRDKPA